MSNVRTLVARQFNRAYHDFIRPKFTRSELLGMAEGDEAQLYACLRELKERGAIRFLEDPNPPGYNTPIVEVLTLVPSDFLDSHEKESFQV